MVQILGGIFLLGTERLKNVGRRNWSYLGKARRSRNAFAAQVVRKGLALALFPFTVQVRLHGGVFLVLGKPFFFVGFLTTSASLIKASTEQIRFKHLRLIKRSALPPIPNSASQTELPSTQSPATSLRPTGGGNDAPEATRPTRKFPLILTISRSGPTFRSRSKRGGVALNFGDCFFGGLFAESWPEKCAFPGGGLLQQQSL